MLPGFCPARFRVLFCSVVLGCRYTPLLDHVVSGATFLSGGVIECDLAHRQRQPDAPSLWCSTCAICAGACYTRCVISHRSTYATRRCRTLQYSRTFIPRFVSLRNDRYVHDPAFYGVGLAGFMIRAAAFLLA